ncbi:MAG: metallophosphoesterase family protein [Planctomycetota bacterium]
MFKLRPSKMIAVILLVGLLLQTGCSLAESQPDTTVFQYDQAALPQAKPWTDRDFKNDPDDFQFAVIGDRTGGADPKGVFVRAIDQLNLLQPEFVMSVGDFIEGYTEDRAELMSDWDEVDGMIKGLEMPFFFTAGNHDLGNTAMKELWIERFGADFYHFVYRDVLFLVLNTEDPPNPVPEDIREFMEVVDEAFRTPANISDRQIAYAREALAQNPDVRWTLVFLHQPCWEMPGDGFLEVEEMLQDRDYTFFAGHMHYYKHEKRHGRDYVTMGPAGASFHKDGPGNVDHILWVSMTDDGPRIAKVTLEGIYDREGRDLQLREMYDRSASALSH